MLSTFRILVQYIAADGVFQLVSLGSHPVDLAGEIQLAEI